MEARLQQIIALLTEIRDAHRAMLQAMTMPLPDPVHVHTPADGSSPLARCWTCRCGYVHERT